MFLAFHGAKSSPRSSEDYSRGRAFLGRSGQTALPHFEGETSPRRCPETNSGCELRKARDLNEDIFFVLIEERHCPCNFPLSVCWLESWLDSWALVAA